MPDAIVIGAGPNGLAAAIRLAESGLSVTVFEAASRPGGAVRTEELTLPGFRHDTFSAVYPAGAASPVFGRMPLAQHGLEWVQPPVCMAHPLEDGAAVLLYRDLDATARSLEDRHPGDGERWAAYVRRYLRGFEGVRATMLAGFPPLVGALRLTASAGPGAAVDFTRMLTGSAQSLGRRLFRSGDARAWLYGAAMHGDVAPQGRGSAIAGFYLNLLGHAVGWPSPRGGAERIVEALVSYLRSLGGELHTDARVGRILASGGQVSGVGLAEGGEHAARIVVADVMPHALVAMAGDALAPWYRALLRRYHHGPGTLKLDWALDAPIPWRAAEVRQAGTVHVGGSEDRVLGAIAAAHHTMPERPFVLLGQQSLADASRAPAGKHTAWAYTHAPAGAVAQLSASEAAEAIEAQVERFAPGFRERILARHVMGPAELEARNENLVHGDVGGGSYILRQAVFRPIPSLSPYSTPLRGLYLGSAATFPGGAVHGVPGDAAARAALRGVRLRS